MLLFTLLLSFACTVGPDYKRPKTPDAQSFTSVDQEQGEMKKVSRTWWTLFQSEKLNQTVERTLRGNETLKSALATLKQSQHLLEAGHGIYYPQINVAATTSRQKLNTGAFGGQFPSRIFNLTTLSGSVSYALDVFGYQRRTIESLTAQMDYQNFITSGAYLSLTGNTVNTMIARAGYQEQVQVAKKIVQFLKEEVALTEAQIKSGRLSESALLGLKSQLLIAEGNIPGLEQKSLEAEHLLSQLAGNAPEKGDENFPSLSELNLKEKLPMMLPSELVQKRPDILASEEELKSASAEVGVATAAMYPSFNITGNYGINGTTIDGLKGAQNNFWNFGLGLTAPIFHGGTLRANKKAAIERYNASLHNFRETILSAFTQVANLVRALENDERELQFLTDALDVSNRNLLLVQTNYKSGIADYIQVLSALNQTQQATDQLVQIKAKRLQDQVALLVALGGGLFEKDDKSNHRNQ